MYETILSCFPYAYQILRIDSEGTCLLMEVADGREIHDRALTMGNDKKRVTICGKMQTSISNLLCSEF